jgi:hypothetical protein
VSTVQNSHFDFHKGSATGKHKSYSYRFEMSDRVIVFTGDTGVSDALIGRETGPDLIISDYHLNDGGNPASAQ